MSTIIEHVRHRVSGATPSDFDGLRLTACGRTFAPLRDERAIAHHEPARSRCAECYRVPR